MGDSGLTSLVAATLALFLAISRDTRRLALVWTSTFIVVTAAVFATKLGLFGWGDGISRLHFRGPSGHATLAFMVWPVVAYVLTMHASNATRRAAVFVSLVIAIAISWLLISQHFHTVPETLAGCVLGAAAACICIHAARVAPRPAPSVTMLTGSVVIAIFLFAARRAAYAIGATQELRPSIGGIRSIYLEIGAWTSDPIGRSWIDGPG